MSTYEQVRNLAYLLNEAEAAGLPEPLWADVDGLDRSPQLQIRCAEWAAWTSWLDAADVETKRIDEDMTLRHARGERFGVTARLVTAYASDEAPA